MELRYLASESLQLCCWNFCKNGRTGLINSAPPPTPDAGFIFSSYSILIQTEQGPVLLLKSGPTLSASSLSLLPCSVTFLQSYTGKRILSPVPPLFKKQNCNAYKHSRKIFNLKNTQMFYHISSPFFVQQQVCWFWQCNPTNTEIRMESKLEFKSSWLGRGVPHELGS